MKIVIAGVLIAAWILGCGVLKKKQSVLDQEDAESQALDAATQAADAAAIRLAADTADAARLNDAARTAFIAKAAKACHMKPSDYIPATKREMAKMCIVFVDGELKVPGSGTHPDLPEENEQGLSTVDGCRFFFDSYVDAQNAFGVKVRTRYRCTYDPKVGLASYKVL